MKILVISDVSKWKGYTELITKIKPDITVLAGDLTSDGFASFWNEAIYRIPAYKIELRKNNIIVKKGVYRWIDNKKPKRFKGNNILEIVERIKKDYRNSKEFLEIRKKIHVDKFYNFLKYAGKKSQVLVIKGDHDKDFEKDYIPEKINKIQGCEEISGKFIKKNSFSFLGLGFDDTHYLKKLKPIIEEFKEKVDIVITHCEQNKMPLVSLLKSKIIIRGHFGSGKYLVNGIPSVLTADVNYTIIELNKSKLPKISQYITKENKDILLKKGSCKPWLSKKSEFEMYNWLKPYPTN